MKLLTMMTGLAATAALFGMAAPACAEQVNISTTGFTPPFGAVGNSVAFSGTANGVTVNVLASGWTASRDANGGLVFAPSYMSRGPLGLGVTSAEELKTGGINRFDRLDNFEGFDFVLFQFDRNVTITSAVLNETSLLNGVRDNESSVGAGMSALPWNSRLDLANGAVFDGLSIDFNDVARYLAPNIITRPDVPFNLGGLAGNVWVIGANLNNDDTVTIGNITSPSYDAFNIQRLTVNTVDAVPEPANWALMLAGFGMVGLGLRRRGQPRRTTLA